MAYRLYVDTHFMWVVPNDDHPYHHSEFAPAFPFCERDAAAPAAVPGHWNHSQHTLLVDRVTQSVFVIDSDTGDSLNALCPASFVPVEAEQEVMRFPLPSSTATHRLIEGLAGAVYLLRGLHLVLVTHARPVASVMGRAVLEVLATEVLPVSVNQPLQDLNRSPTILHEESQCLQSLQRHLDSNTLLFSRDYDVSVTLQKTADFATLLAANSNNASKTQSSGQSSDTSAKSSFESAAESSAPPQLPAPAPWLASVPAFASELIGRAEDCYFYTRAHAATLLHAHQCSVATLSPALRAAAGLPSGFQLTQPLHSHPAFTAPSLARTVPALRAPALPSRGDPSLAAPFILVLVSGTATTATFALPSPAAPAVPPNSAGRRPSDEAGGLVLSVTTIARRSRFRTGGRLAQRGINARGHAGAQVETEQIVQLYATIDHKNSNSNSNSKAQLLKLSATEAETARALNGGARVLPRAPAPRLLLTAISSFVMLRGSAPVPFAQAPAMLFAGGAFRFPIIAPAPAPAPFAVADSNQPQSQQEGAATGLSQVPPAALSALDDGTFAPRLIAALAASPRATAATVFPAAHRGGSALVGAVTAGAPARALAAVVAELDRTRARDREQLSGGDRGNDRE